MIRTLVAATAGLAATVAVLAGTARAEWPERAVTLIVPWSAGGGTDATGRALAQHLEERFGQPFNVVNRTGGGGLVGHSAIASAEPDGQTLGVITVEISMYGAQGNDHAAQSQYALIGRYNADAVGIHVKADSPYQTAEDLIDAIKADPGAIKASGANRGGLAHLGWAGMLSTLGIDADAGPWVASEGAAPALQQLAAGAIDVVSTTLAEAQPLVDAGEIRTLAILANERNPSFPDVPSMPEALDIRWAPLSFRGLAGPKGLPDEIAEQVSAALGEITSDPEFVAFMDGRGFSIDYLDREDFTTFAAEAEKNFTAAIEAAGL